MYVHKHKGNETGMQFIDNKTDIRIINECIALLRIPKSESKVRTLA